jgi:tetratricopeptide (TPR) repeat protein
MAERDAPLIRFGVEVKIVKSLLLLASVVTASQAGNNYQESGSDHFYNLEYDQAIHDYTKLIEENPTDPTGYNDLAGAYLYKEAYRLGLLDSSAVSRGNSFLHLQRPQPDSNAEARVLETLDRGQRAAEGILAQDAHNKQALYSLCANYSLRANNEFILQRAWFAALRSVSRAKTYCEQVQRLDPDFVDAYLIPGVFEYVAGSLPLAVKMFAAVGGLRGSTKKGLEMVSRVARSGNYERETACVVLAVLYRRERRPLDARVMESLSARYPRNYIFRLELAAMYSEGGQTDRARDTLKGLMQADASRIPPAVRREVVEMETRLQPATAPSQPLTFLEIQ